jgi:hypothetical protein
MARTQKFTHEKGRRGAGLNFNGEWNFSLLD